MDGKKKKDVEWRDRRIMVTKYGGDAGW